MKIKSKSMLSIILALNLIFSIGYANNIDSYATVIDENEVIDKWETKTPMPTKRGNFASAVVNGKIYCIGGENNSSNKLNKVEVYDPETDTWETKTSMPTTRGYLASAVVDGKIYCIGGFNASKLNTVEVYDPETDTWETKTPMPTFRDSFASVVVNGKVYCIGGENNSSNKLNKVEVYDPETDSWETKTPMPTSRAYLTSEVVNGKIYCIGGANGSSRFNTVEVYDPETDTWETKASMPTTRTSLTGAVVNGKIYCIGGYNGSSRFNTVEVYDPETDTWETKSPMPTTRWAMASSVINGKIYCIGGYGGSSYLNTVEVYTPNINTPEYRAEQAVISAENSNETADIETARNLVNQLEENEFKNELQDRLNAIVPDLALDIKNTTANVDVYIKSENMLLMSLSTNSITFEDYSGVEDMEKVNAVNISINSSLPYQLNAYLIDEIYNSDKSKKIDMDRLNIKDNEDADYKEFTAINDKLILKDNCESGNDLSHNIDLKLKGGNAYPADIYKTVIKFEAEQK